MTTSFSQTTVSAFVGGLTTLKNLLERAATYAEEKKIEPRALLDARLFPDMFTFARQIYAAGDVARRSVDRLSGKELDSSDKPDPSFATLIEYVNATIAYVEASDEALLDASETSEVIAKFGSKAKVTFTGRSYVATFALPNFLFHVVTAYNILRHNGMDLGKHAYLAPFIAR